MFYYLLMKLVKIRFPLAMRVLVLRCLSSPEAKKPNVGSRQADMVQKTHAEVTLIAECRVLGSHLHHAQAQHTSGRMRLLSG